MRGTKAKAIRRAIESQFQVGFRGEPEYSIGTKYPFIGSIIHNPGTARAYYRQFKRAYKRWAMSHLGS
jgi:hypothetical protein